MNNSVLKRHHSIKPNYSKIKTAAYKMSTRKKKYYKLVRITIQVN